jgi:hypothetical protein
MGEKNEIRAVEIVRRIRDEMATVPEGKSHAEIIAYFKKSGDVAREEAKRRRKTESQTELHG